MAKRKSDNRGAAERSKQRRSNAKRAAAKRDERYDTTQMRTLIDKLRETEANLTQLAHKYLHTS